jgi:hypothetical protein
MPSKFSAALAVRISAEAEQLRRELEAEMKLPANRIVEAAFRRLKADLDRRASDTAGRSEDAAPTRAAFRMSGRCAGAPRQGPWKQRRVGLDPRTVHEF